MSGDRLFSTAPPLATIVRTRSAWACIDSRTCASGKPQGGSAIGLERCRGNLPFERIVRYPISSIAPRSRCSSTSVRGFLGRRDKETRQFLRYAIASNGEVKAGYYAADGRHYLTNADKDSLMTLNEDIARMLCCWNVTLTAEH